MWDLDRCTAIIPHWYFSAVLTVYMIHQVCRGSIMGHAMDGKGAWKCVGCGGRCRYYHYWYFAAVLTVYMGMFVVDGVCESGVCVGMGRCGVCGYMRMGGVYIGSLAYMTFMGILPDCCTALEI